MWSYDKKLQFPVKIKNPNANYAKIIISQLGGPDGELAASMRYLNQRYSMPYGEIIGILTDVGIEDKNCTLNKKSPYAEAYGERKGDFTFSGSAGGGIHRYHPYKHTCLSLHSCRASYQSSGQPESFRRSQKQCIGHHSDRQPRIQNAKP